MSALPSNGIYKIGNIGAHLPHKFLATNSDGDNIKISLRAEANANKWILKDQTLREGRDDVITLQAQAGSIGEYGFFAPEGDNHNHDASVGFTRVVETIIATHVKENVYTIRFTKKRTLGLESGASNTVKLTHITGEVIPKQQWKFIQVG